ncbi:hypothetical protein OU567_01140, partial [Escherichia coli]|nr:hypothetical protein [Escherichia coli]
MTLDLPRRFPWPTLLSVCIHGAVVAGLVFSLFLLLSLFFISRRPPPSLLCVLCWSLLIIKKK